MPLFNNIFNIDFDRLIMLFLPEKLHDNIVVAYLRAAVKPLKDIKILFDNNRKENLYRLGITPQVFSLEKMLNDRYDNVLRRIFISNGSFIEPDYIYTRAEQKPKYIYTRAEQKPDYLYQHSEIGYDNVDFYVNIPASLNISESEVDELLEIYKLAGKVHAIKRF